MLLLKTFNSILLPAGLLMLSHSIFASTNVYDSEDDWQYHINGANIIKLNIDLDSIESNKQSATTGEQATVEAAQQSNDPVQESSESAQESNSSNDNTIELSFIKYNARTPMVKGVALLVNDYSQPRQMNSNLMFLAKNLPDFGFNTILIDNNLRLIKLLAQSEVAEQDKKLEGPEQPKNEELPATETQKTVTTAPEISLNTGLKPHMQQAPFLQFTPKQYNKALELILTNLESKYLTKPGYTLYVSHGMSAFSLVKNLSEQSQFKADALAITNPYWPEYQKNEEIAKNISNIDIPMLDLVSSQDNSWASTTHRKRYVAAKNAFLPFYRQRELANGRLNAQQMEYQKKELLSWLKYLGW